MQDNKANHKKKLFKDSLYYIIGMIMVQFVPFALLPILTRYLSQYDFGQYAMLNILIIILGVVAGLQAYSYVAVYFFKCDKKELVVRVNNTIVLLFITSLILLFCFIVLQDPLSKLFHLNLKWLLYALLISVLSFFRMLLLTIWRCEQKPLSYVLLSMSFVLLQFGFVFLFVIRFHGGWPGTVYSLLAANLISCVISLYILWKKKYISLDFDKSNLIEITKFSLPIVPYGVSNWLSSAVDRLIIASVLGLNIAGIYAASLQVALGLSVIANAFNQAWVPYIYKQLSIKNSEEDLRKNKLTVVKVTYKLSSGFLIFGIFYGLIAVVFAQYILPESYAKHWFLIFILCIATGLIGVYHLFSSYFYMQHKTGTIALISLIGVILKAAVTYAATVSIGLLGTGYALIIANFIIIILMFWGSHKVHPMPWFKAISRRRSA